MRCKACTRYEELEWPSRTPNTPRAHAEANTGTFSRPGITAGTRARPFGGRKSHAIPGRRQFDAEILRFEIEASDANVVREKWLLAVGIDCVLRFDVEKMPKSPQEGRRTGHWEEPEDIGAQPSWEESTFEQSSRNMATV
jgi:hypothetical protein